MTTGRCWTIVDRGERESYLTQERWEHIIESYNHPEMSAYEEQLKDTIRRRFRQQDSLNSLKYRYVEAFDNLAEDNMHIVAFVLFRFSEDESGAPLPNK